ncbi:MAG TPA: shikimate kinase [Chitinophagaceae bacterium]|nr:shikimate kinase [Chitinophagaceae bacterium]
MRFFLVGLPGSGKSFWGKKIATFLNLKFIDLDEEIIKSKQKDIHALFGENGENDFREIEHSLLKEIINQSTNFILSTGGGTPCFKDNLNLMKKGGAVFFLDSSIKSIAERLMANHKNERPLLEYSTQDELMILLSNLLNKRRKFYEQAHKVLDLDKLSEAEILNHFIV